jgi:hypothetical protein
MFSLIPIILVVQKYRRGATFDFGSETPLVIFLLLFATGYHYSRRCREYLCQSWDTHDEKRGDRKFRICHDCTHERHLTTR